MAIGHGKPVGRVFSFYNPPPPTPPAPPTSGWEAVGTNLKAVASAAVIATQATSFAVPPNPPTPAASTIPLVSTAGASRKTRVYYQSKVDPLRPIAPAAPAPPSGWMTTPALAPPVAKAVPTQATSFAVPLIRSNTITGIGWHQSLATAAPVAQPQAGSSFVPFNTPQVSGVVPQGWQTIQSAAPARAVINGGPSLTFAVAPFAVPSQGWQTQLSTAPPVAKAQQGFAFVPFDTKQINTVDIGKWQQPLSGAPPVARAQVGISLVPFDTRQINTVDIGKWQQPLSVAAPVAKAQPGSTFVPLDTAQTIPPPPQGWQGPLSIAAPVAQAQQGLASVPFNTPQVTPAPPSGWQTIVSNAPARPVVNSSALTFVVKPPITPSGWQSQLSTAAPTAKAQAGFSSVPLNTAQVIPPPPSGWYVPLSVAVAVAKAQPGASFVPFNTAQIAAPSFVPLSSVAGGPRKTRVYYQSRVQPLPPIVMPPVAPPAGWLSTTSFTPPVAKAQPTQATSFAVPPSVGTPTPSQFGWYAPLSKAAPVAKADPGQFSVPFNTAQVAPPTFIIPLAYDAASIESRFVYYQASVRPLPPIAPPLPNTIVGTGWVSLVSYTAKVAVAWPTQATSFAVPPSAAPPPPTPGQFGWYAPLSKAAPVAIAQVGYSFVPFNTAQIVITPPTVPLAYDANTPGYRVVYHQSLVLPPRLPVVLPNTIVGIGWYQPLSVAAPVARAQVGSTFVPFDKKQINSITGIGWYQQLSVAAPVARAQVGSSFVPLNTKQVIPPVVVSPPGGYSRKRWGASYPLPTTPTEVKKPVERKPVETKRPVLPAEIVGTPEVPDVAREIAAQQADDEAAVLALIEQYLADEAAVKALVADILFELIDELEDEEHIDEAEALALIEQHLKDDDDMRQAALAQLAAIIAEIENES